VPGTRPSECANAFFPHDVENFGYPVRGKLPRPWAGGRPAGAKALRADEAQEDFKGRPPKEGICSDANFEPDRDLYVALAIAESRASAATCDSEGPGRRRPAGLRGPSPKLAMKCQQWRPQARAASPAATRLGVRLAVDSDAGPLAGRGDSEVRRRRRRVAVGCRLPARPAAGHWH
jgi:hypothetical protein